MTGDSIPSALQAFAEYPLSLTVLGAIAIITAGIIYNATLVKLFYSVLLLLFAYIAVTLINSWWFRAGRFRK
jgi:hypothetical protein